MHNLKAERFYKETLAGGMMMSHDGPIKTFPLRGIKDSPPYLNDGRSLTLEDTIEYFNLIQQLHLTAQENVVRKEPKALEIAGSFFSLKKPVVAICHGPQIPISADLLQGRRATCYKSVADELKGAGASPGTRSGRSPARRRGPEDFRWMKNQIGPFTDLPDPRQLAIYASWAPEQRWERAVSLRDEHTLVAPGRSGSLAGSEAASEVTSESRSERQVDGRDTARATGVVSLRGHQRAGDQDAGAWGEGDTPGRHLR
jgi:hypothetical protein